MECGSSEGVRMEGAHRVEEHCTWREAGAGLGGGHAW